MRQEDRLGADRQGRKRLALPGQEHGRRSRPAGVRRIRRAHGRPCLGLRALAGAQGNEKARIFCREFHAELVAVAGHYKVLEDIPKELRGKAVQVWLDQGQLRIAALD